jgi:hypothetical protein
MAELFCTAFLMSFLLFYSVLLLVLVGCSLRGVWQYFLKRASTLRGFERFRALGWSAESPRN